MTVQLYLAFIDKSEYKRSHVYDVDLYTAKICIKYE